MYNAFYGFKCKPFNLTPDPDFLFPSAAHKKALAYLEYGVRDQAGFVAVTGEIGAGKTTLLRAMLDKIPAGVKTARIHNTNVTASELLEMVLADLGIEPYGKGKPQLLDLLNQVLVREAAKGHPVVLIVDEAQNLSGVLLEEIRMLSNLETGKRKLLQIILVGQPELRDRLCDPSLEQLRQRITVNYHLPPLSPEETEAYVRHRLAVAGGNGKPSFSEDALDEIHKAAGGVPRRINVLCDAVLLAGFVDERTEFDGEAVRAVIRELHEDVRGGARPDKPMAAAADPVLSRLALLEAQFGLLSARFDDELQETRRLFLTGKKDAELFQLELLTKMERLNGMEMRISAREAAVSLGVGRRAGRSRRESDAEVEEKIRTLNQLIARLTEEIEKYQELNRLAMERLEARDEILLPSGERGALEAR